MSAINTGKVVVGGLVAGVVFNVLDVVNQFLLMPGDFEAGLTRLGLDPATAEAPVSMGTWIVIDFLMGLLVVYLYAAIRPRFGAGPKTAATAGIILWAAVSLVTLGLTMMGLFTMGMYVKITIIQLVFSVIGAVAGARFYSEGPEPAAA